MAKLNLNDIGTSFQARQALNENFNLIEQAFENTLSLGGTAPNAMQADLNLNGNDVINVGTLDAQTLTLGGDTVALNDIQTLTDIADNIQTLAHFEDGTTFEGGLTALVPSVPPVFNRLDDVSAVSDNISAVQILASDIGGAGFPFDLGSITDETTETPTEGGSRVVAVATNVNSVLTVATNIANVNLVAAIDENITAIANNETNINTIATNISNVNTTATDISNVNTIATNIANVNTTATNIANVNLVASIDSDVSSVAAIDNNVTTVATNIANVNTTASGISNINTAATNIQAIIDAPQAATDAESARDKAQLWSQEGEDVEVETGLFSAFHWAQKAASFAQGDAVNISYSNLTSGLSATNAQTAIDELAAEKANLAGGNTFTGTQNITGDVNITGVLDCGSIA